MWGHALGLYLSADPTLTSLEAMKPGLLVLLSPVFSPDQG